MELDQGKYALSLALARRRTPSLDLSVIAFDESLHPRDWQGHFKKALGGMKRGDVREFASGVKVERKYANFKVTSPSGDAISPKSLTDTVKHAMAYDAKTTHPQSIGGEKSTTVDAAAKQAKSSVEPSAIRGAMEKLTLQHTHLLDNQLESARQSILDAVDPAGKPPAKDGAEAIKRLKANPGVAGRGSSWIGSSFVRPDDEQYIKRFWEAIQTLRGK